MTVSSNVRRRKMTASSTFESWNSYWAFSVAVRHKSRFFHDRRVNRFLRAVAASAEGRVAMIAKDKALWRAQTGHEWEDRLAVGDVPYEEPVPFKPERMKPQRGSAHEGRVNARGIPCLYAASNKETAVAELRPWLGALVSVSKLGPLRELRLVDCSEGHDSEFEVYFDEPSPEEREKSVWRAIGRAFSEPANPDPGVAEYVPTQVLAEHFRNQGYDGVVYKSRLGPGFNLAVFDLDALEVLDVCLYPVKAVQYEIGELQKSYVVKHRRREA